MPWESIGSLSTGDVPEELALKEALTHLLRELGPPPPWHELGICSQDHDYGSYPTLGVYAEFTPDQDYVRRCEDALLELDGSDRWTETLQKLAADLQAYANAQELWDQAVAEVRADVDIPEVSDIPGLDVPMAELQKIFGSLKPHRDPTVGSVALTSAGPAYPRTMPKRSGMRPR